MDACASETESPSCKHRSISRTKPSSTPEKRDKLTSDEASWEQHESPMLRPRSISRTRQSSLTEKYRHIIGDGSPSDPSVKGRRSRSQTRHSKLKEKDNPQRNITSSSRQQQGSCQSADELQSSQHKATRKSKVMPKESDPKTRMRSTTTFDRSGKSREMDGSNEAIHVVLFDEDSEDDTCNDSAPATPSSKRSNVLTQHLQNLEATPGSAKTTPGRSKQQIKMVRSSSIGRRRGTSNDDSDSERGPMKRGNLKTPSSGAKTPRQSSILRRNSTKFQGGGPHCPDLNSSKTCYL